MSQKDKYIVGTSGYAFNDWIGRFYPAGITTREMFTQYASRFDALELNFTFYRIPSAKNLKRLADESPKNFLFWVKANRQITHQADLSISDEFVDNLAPLNISGKLAGVLLQFPQSFRRTRENRIFLSKATKAMAKLPLAVEFRHYSWVNPLTLQSLRENNITLVVPDCPAIPSLFHISPIATTPTGYLRLHSRNAEKWYADMAQRYDYSYSKEELIEIIHSWKQVVSQVERMFVFFNNCHHAQAALNAETFCQLISQVG